MKLIDRILNSKDPPSPKQPDTCKGCVWGRWEAAKQFCSKQVCVKEGGKK